MISKARKSGSLQSGTSIRHRLSKSKESQAELSCISHSISDQQHNRVQVIHFEGFVRSREDHLWKKPTKYLFPKQK
ncbi:hypothetical protein V3C99_010688 [Haemonchus contortus]